jgi:hypothetical protein
MQAGALRRLLPQRAVIRFGDSGDNWMLIIDSQD